MQLQYLPKNQCTAKVYAKGKINLPANLKDDLSIHDGDQVIFIKRANTWKLTTRELLIKEAQEYSKQLNPTNESLVDSLLEERRLNAIQESI